MKVIPCDCESEYQDKVYGKQLRLHNQTIKKPTSSGGWACTVCGKIKGK
jgi:hypothetical protein